MSNVNLSLTDEELEIVYNALEGVPYPGYGVFDPNNPIATVRAKIEKLRNDRN